MLKLLTRISERYNCYMNHVSRIKAHEVLLRSSDRMLEDAGFSRELLDKGVAAWPWRQADGEQRLKPVDCEELAPRQANAEQDSFSENGLHGLNVTSADNRDTATDNASGAQGERVTIRKVA